jgi:chorismate mutase
MKMKNNIFLVHRKEIDKIDNELMELLKKRLESARKIGIYKKKHKIKIVNKEREKEVLKDRIKKSKLSKDFTKKLFSIIIKESREVQK